MSRVLEVHLEGQRCLSRYRAVTTTDPFAVTCWACRRTRKQRRLGRLTGVA